METRRPFAHKIALLSALYFVEGLPHGFRLTALPVYLRGHGISLTAIGLAASLLSLPWVLKVLWAPAVDRFGSGRLGRRRSWILPMQAGLALACLAAMATRPDDQLFLLLALIFVMNFCAATMDIAVDGLAVDLLERHELGYGNSAQVVGYKLGLLSGGGLLLWASTWIGWRGLFGAMAALVGLVFLLTLLTRPPAPDETVQTQSVAVGEIAARVRRALQAPDAVWVIVFIASYKLGESMADAMFRPFLVDAGYSASQIGLWIGSWGMGFSLAGSLAGGVLASRLPILRAVGIAAVLRVVPLAGVWWLSVVPEPGKAAVITVTAAESFFGGALTTALFAFMMSMVDKRIGATHYTLLATIEVAGKFLGSSISGVVGDAFGFPVVFGTAVVLSVAFLGLLIPVSRARGPDRRSYECPSGFE